VKRILVTGGAGFIGSNFVHYMLAEHSDVEIVTLDSLTYAGSMENLVGLPDPTRHAFVRGDIGNAALIRRIFRLEGFDTIVHFAAETHVDQSIENPAIFIRTNVLGTFTLLEVAREKGIRFHHVSTDEVYGSLGVDDRPFDEMSPYRPNSPYSASKAASDHFVRAYGKTYSLPVTISHCSNNYGPRQHSEKLIPTVIRSVMDGKPIPIYGNGLNRREWLYVEDHCRAIDVILRRGALGETYCVGGEEMSNLDVVRAVGAVMDRASIIDFVKDRLGHDWRYALDSSKIRALGWAPRESFASGIAKVL
jgi:dTDP-glucose 4,6-dehydratase